jgi:hypothetical protein
LRGFEPCRCSGAIADGKTDGKKVAKNARGNGPLTNRELVDLNDSALIPTGHEAHPDPHPGRREKVRGEERDKIIGQ